MIITTRAGRIRPLNTVTTIPIHPPAATMVFFTSTHDRSRACTKHGGIDVWLSL
jgi:hypothetical protein